MLEREADWDQFLFCLENNRPAELVAEHFGIPYKHVHYYRAMFSGSVEAAEIPENLKKHAVGFKYQDVIRWIDTPAIKKAREDHDAGLVDVMTGAGKIAGEKVWVLYAIPRVNQDTKREPYFSRVELP